ncbi:MAG: hypothetical protein FJ303_12835 [Planctomycetes bacterium]|nr:hypothetical protein [Planctomycetota bacterium]
MSIDCGSASTGVPTPAPASRPRPLSRRIMHQVRRLHLFLGLFLLPWVLLYRSYGFLFSHQTVFPDQPTRTFGPDEVCGAPLEGLPRPADMAEEVVAALNEKGCSYCVVRPDEAAFSRSRVTVQTRVPGVEHSVVGDVQRFKEKGDGWEAAGKAPTPRIVQRLVPWGDDVLAIGVAREMGNVADIQAGTVGGKK